MECYKLDRFWKYLVCHTEKENINALLSCFLSLLKDSKRETDYLEKLYMKVLFYFLKKSLEKRQLEETYWYLSNN